MDHKYVGNSVELTTLLFSPRIKILILIFLCQAIRVFHWYVSCVYIFNMYYQVVILDGLCYIFQLSYSHI